MVFPRTGRASRTGRHKIGCSEGQFGRQVAHSLMYPIFYWGGLPARARAAMRSGLRVRGEEVPARTILARSIIVSVLSTLGARNSAGGQQDVQRQSTTLSSPGSAILRMVFQRLAASIQPGRQRSAPQRTLPRPSQISSEGDERAPQRAPLAAWRVPILDRRASHTRVLVLPLDYAAGGALPSIGRWYHKPCRSRFAALLRTPHPGLSDSSPVFPQVFGP